MKKYNCDSCDFHTNHKPNFERHLQTIKHKKCCNINMDLSNISDTIVPKKIHECKYCGKILKHHTSLSRHIKYTCKKNEDEDFKELARLMNEKDRYLVEVIKDNNNQMNKMYKQIEKLKNKLQIQNINNGIINNNTINIQLLNHGESDYSHITPTDYISCIKSCNKCVKQLIEKVHFNNGKPENMNIYLSNIKGKYIMVYKENSWQICDKKEQIDDLYDHNEMMLENWYDEYKDKYPQMIKSFQRYLKNRDENDILNRVKEEILVMLYNKRKMIESES